MLLLIWWICFSLIYTQLFVFGVGYKFQEQKASETTVYKAYWKLSWIKGGFVQTLLDRIKEREDLAMLNVSQQTKGGIDLNNLNMQTSGQATNIQISTDKVMMNQKINFLTPQIIRIGEIQLGVFLGLNTERNNSNDSSNPSHDLLAIKEEV